METSISGASHAVVHAQNERCGLGPIETINSGHNAAVVSAQNHRGELGPIVTWNSRAKALFECKKNVGEVWEQ